MPLVFGNGQRRGGGCGGRVLIAILLACFAIGSYYCNTQKNPITGESQRVAMTPEDDVKMGLVAAPEMIRQMGGEAPDPRAQDMVDRMGAELLANVPNLDQAPYQWDFHVLADPKTINAFALPGGQVFITEALFKKLETPGQLAGVLGHEIGHVIYRHSAQQMAKQQLLQGLSGAAAVAAYDPDHPNREQAAMVVALVGNFINLSYGRDAENQSDGMGVELSSRAGYDPRSMIRVMEILKEASGGSRTPEWASTHPDPGNRMEHIKQLIQQKYPNGVPEGMKP